MGDQPTCAVCHKPVDSFEREDDLARMQWAFTARCHGAEERVMVNMPTTKPTSITFGEAFLPALPEHRPDGGPTP